MRRASGTRRRRWALLSSILSAALCAAVIHTQSVQLVMLDLGAVMIDVGPKVEIPLPLTLDASEDGPVQITMEVAYPIELLTFTDIQPGASLKDAKAQLRAEKKPAPAGATEQVITIEITSPQALKSGLLATLNFGLGSAAKVGAEIHVRNVKQTAKSAGGEALTTRGAEGMITLLEPPTPCFFYMH